MENKVIGIEGYVGAGKTAICRELLNLIPNSIIKNVFAQQLRDYIKVN